MSRRLTIEEVFAEAAAHGFADFRIEGDVILWGQPHGSHCPECQRTRSRIKNRYDEAVRYIRAKAKGP